MARGLASLILPAGLRAQLADEARKAYPRECCGLIEGLVEGLVEGDVARACTLHPTANLGTGDDRFAIDPAAQIRLLKALRGTARAVIGCYHSHPDGKAEPSPRDLEGAGEEGFVWLIQPVTEQGAAPPGLFVFERGRFRVLAERRA